MPVKRRTGDLPCTGCGIVFHLKYTTLRRAEKKGFYRCHPCTIKDPDYRAKHKAGVQAIDPEQAFAARSAGQKARYERDGTEQSQANARRFYTDPKFEEKRKEHRRKLSEKWSDPEYVARQHAIRSTPEFKQRIGGSIREAMNDPKVRARHKAAMESEETRARLSAANKKVWERPGYRKKMVSKAEQSWRNADSRERMLRGIREAAADPSVRERHLTAMTSDEVRGKLRRLWENEGYRTNRIASIRALWGDPDYCKNHADAMTRPEVRFRLSAASLRSWSNTEARVGRLAILAGVMASPSYRSNHLASMRSEVVRKKLRDVWSDDEFRRMRSEAIRVMWANPLYRENHATAMSSDKTKARLSEARRLTWSSSAYREKMAVIRSTMPVVSSLNKAIFSILKNWGIKHSPEHPVGPWNFDVFIPAQQAIPNTEVAGWVIEAQGEYWHSLPRAIRNDKSKATYIERYFPELRLVTIWELEFHTPGRVEHTLRRALGLLDEPKVHPDFTKLQISEITSKQAAEVYSQHYLGSARGKTHYGLLYQGKLIGACSFGPFQRNEQTLKYGKAAVELTRFCLDSAHQVKNLGSWFLSRCLKRIGKPVVTYADSTFGHDGALYKACNFQFSHEVPSDYSYLADGGWILHKRTVYGRAVKMGMTEAEYVAQNSLVKKWGGTKRCFVFNLFLCNT